MLIYFRITYTLRHLAQGQVLCCGSQKRLPPQVLSENACGHPLLAVAPLEARYGENQSAPSRGHLAGADAEWVWAEPQDDGTYAIKNVPFYAQGISCEDIVRADRQAGVLLFKGVARHGGHSAYRIYAEAGRKAADVAALLGTLRSMHCDIEPATDKLVGVDVLPEADIYEVYPCEPRARRDNRFSGGALRPSDASMTAASQSHRHVIATK
jgi:hypothetical protein